MSLVQKNITNLRKLDICYLLCNISYWFPSVSYSKMQVEDGLALSMFMKFRLNWAGL